MVDRDPSSKKSPMVTNVNFLVFTVLYLKYTLKQHLTFNFKDKFLTWNIIDDVGGNVGERGLPFEEVWEQTHNSYKIKTSHSLKYTHYNLLNILTQNTTQAII